MQGTNNRLVQYRRMFHRYPEQGWLPFFASAFIAEQLERCGYEVLVGREIFGDEPLMDPPTDAELQMAQKRAVEIAKQIGFSQMDKWLDRMEQRTGVLAIHDTKLPGKTLACRFDMDALAVPESMDADRVPVREGFVSAFPGLSHACGHDGHMALGLVLAEEASRQNLVKEGRLIFIFQPAEEGVRGGRAFCNCWKWGRIDRLICSHIGFAPDGYLVTGATGFLATTKFDVTFTGKSAHAGKAPERGRNALMAAVEAAYHMQQIKKPEEGICRLNVGQLRGGENRNTIPASAWMQIETRGDTAERNTYMKMQALYCIEAAAKQYGVTYEVTYQGESVSAVSDEILAKRLCERNTVAGYFSKCQTDWEFGASDDGAVFMDLVQQMGGQAVYLLFGTKVRAPHHETEFDFSEEVLVPAFQVLFDGIIS